MNVFLRLLLVLAVPTLFLSGCGSSNDKPIPMADDRQVDDMVNARKIFDESDKNWDTLPADKKAQYTKLVRATGEAAAKKWWDTMAHPVGVGTGPSTGGR